MTDEDDLAEEIQRQAQERIDILGGEIEVPAGVSEEEAMRTVQEQFRKAGLECPDDEARRIVRSAWDKQ
jgi:hypothetical protein